MKEGSTPFDRLCTLEFVEHLMQKGCGANTPKAVLLALDYYGKAFGFESQKGHFGRAKRLSMKCVGNEFINALECIVMDPFLHSPQHVAAGKLRLCIQSSTRYDDILKHTIGAVRVGEEERRVIHHRPPIQGIEGQEQGQSVDRIHLGNNPGEVTSGSQR